MSDAAWPCSAGRQLRRKKAALPAQGDMMHGFGEKLKTTANGDNEVLRKRGSIAGEHPLQDPVAPHEIMIEGCGDMQSDQAEQNIGEHNVDVSGEEADFCLSRNKVGEGDEIEDTNGPVAGRCRGPAEDRQNQ